MMIRYYTNYVNPRVENQGAGDRESGLLPGVKPEAA